VLDEKKKKSSRVSIYPWPVRCLGETGQDSHPAACLRMFYSKVVFVTAFLCCIGSSDKIEASSGSDVDGTMTDSRFFAFQRSSERHFPTRVSGVSVPAPTCIHTYIHTYTATHIRLTVHHMKDAAGCELSPTMFIRALKSGVFRCFLRSSTAAVLVLTWNSMPFPMRLRSVVQCLSARGWHQHPCANLQTWPATCICISKMHPID
jgi:hypothetical protein